MNPVALIATIKINLLRRPLWESDSVEECLDISREKLMAMIECGELAWAWNIGLGSTRQELRILGHCVVERQMGVIPQIGATRNLKLPDVVNLILPGTRETLRGTELQKLFLCNPDQIRRLRVSGDLEVVPESLPPGGPNSSPRYTRASVAKFLEKRRVV